MCSALFEFHDGADASLLRLVLLGVLGCALLHGRREGNEQADSELVMHQRIVVGHGGVAASHSHTSRGAAALFSHILTSNLFSHIPTHLQLIQPHTHSPSTSRFHPPRTGLCLRARRMGIRRGSKAAERRVPWRMWIWRLNLVFTLVAVTWVVRMESHRDFTSERSRRIGRRG